MCGLGNFSFLNTKNALTSKTIFIIVVLYEFFISHKNPDSSNEANTDGRRLSNKSKNGGQQRTRSGGSGELDRGTSQTDVNNGGTPQNPQAATTSSDQTGEVITIPVTRGQITPEMVGRGNKIDSLTDFKVLISLSMSNKIQQETDINLAHRAYGGDLSLDYPSSAKIVRIFTSSTFTGKILLTLSSYIIFTLIR